MKHTEETKQKMSIARKGLPSSFKGHKHTEESNKKNSDSHRVNPTKYWLGKTFSCEHREKLANARRGIIIGEKHGRWIFDRTKLAQVQERNDSAYKEWRKSVKDRDGWTCKMSNGDCERSVVAHHILSWSQFPDLRYKINNGITLCRFHHPRKRADEIKLSPYFKNMVEDNRK